MPHFILLLLTILSPLFGISGNKVADPWQYLHPAMRLFMIQSAIPEMIQDGDRVGRSNTHLLPESNWKYNFNIEKKT